MRHACSTRTTIFLLGFAGIMACSPHPPPASSSAPPSHPAPTTSPERQPNPPVSIPEEQTPSPTPSKPVAKVLEILAGRDDPNDRRIRIEVSNPTDKPCTVKGYTVSWGSSKKSMPLADTVIPPGESRQRFLIVHPRDGRVETLTVDGATVDMQYECDR